MTLEETYDTIVIWTCWPEAAHAKVKMGSSPSYTKT